MNETLRETPQQADSGSTRNTNQQIVAQATSFSGPLPPPEILARYNQVLPGAAERIIVMAEKQASHRQGLESRVIRSDTINARLGLVFGLIVGLAGVSGSVVISIFGHATSGAVLGIATISSLVGVFVYGSQQRRGEREKRRREAEK